VPRPALPHLRRRELEHPHRDDVLVVRAVEDADLATHRERRVHAPEVVVRELGRRRRLERHHLAALRVDALEDAPDDTVLPGRIEPLEDEQQRVLALGEEAPLQPLEHEVQLRKPLVGARLVLQSEVVLCVALREVRLRSRIDPDLVEHGRILVGIHSAPWPTAASSTSGS
jgi:hypothetical protein